MSDVDVIFDYWREHCNHPTAKLGGVRRGKIKARLKDGYSVAEIKRAIDGAALRPFVSEGGRVFDDLELICRSEVKLESFIARAEQPYGNGRPSALARADAYLSAPEYEGRR